MTESENPPVYTRLLMFILRSVVFLLVSLLLLEGFFRYVLHARDYPRSIQDPATGVSFSDTSWVTGGTGSFGPYCLPMGRWRINNAGWNSIFDYYPRSDPSRPRIAVLGNSYIEGWAADVEAHLDAELFRLLGGDADVYAFGISGATFAQYLGTIPYIERQFDPDLYLVMLSSFGITRSLDPGVSPFRFYVSLSDSGYTLLPPPQVYVQNKFGRIVFRSALARYLFLNRQAGVKGLNIDAEEMVADPGIEEALASGYIAAGAFFLESFEDALPGKKVIFFADGNREEIYDGIAARCQVMDYRILDALIEDGSMFTAVDMTDFMSDVFAEDGILFSRDYDPHWNNYAHETAARALLPYVQEALAELGF